MSTAMLEGQSGAPLERAVSIRKSMQMQARAPSAEPAPARDLKELLLDTSELNLQSFYAASTPFDPACAAVARAKRVSFDARTLKNPHNHGTPKALDATLPRIHGGCDVDGYPFKNAAHFPAAAPSVSHAEKLALFRENPDLLKVFKRVRNDERLYNLRQRTCAPSTVNWLRYLFGLGPLPGQKTSRKPWPERAALEARRRRDTKRKSPKKELQITEEQIEQNRRIFQLIAGEGKDSIGAEQAVELVRTWGFVPSDAECAALAQAGDVTYERLLAFCQSVVHTEDDVAENLVRIFSELDVQDSGKISKLAFETILENYGEGIDAQVVEEVLAAGSFVENGAVNYRQFVEKLTILNYEPLGFNSYKKFGIKLGDLADCKAPRKRKAVNL